MLAELKKNLIVCNLHSLFDAIEISLFVCSDIVYTILLCSAIVVDGYYQSSFVVKGPDPLDPHFIIHYYHMSEVGQNKGQIVLSKNKKLQVN